MLYSLVTSIVELSAWSIILSAPAVDTPGCFSLLPRDNNIYHRSAHQYIKDIK